MSATILKRLPYYSNQTWTSDPDEVEILIPRTIIIKINNAVRFLKKSGGHQIVFWNSVDYRFLSNNQDGHSRYFEPEYRIELCETKVDFYGDLGFVFHFKNIDEEFGWTDEFNVLERS